MRITTTRRWAGVRLRLVALLPVLLLASPLAPTQLAPPARAAGPLQGPDVSKYQHDTGKAIDWNAVKRAGQSFAFIKATGGSDRTDPWFEREWAAAGKAGMIRGAYHYADPRHSADAQAAHIVSVVGSTREANNLGIVLDTESTGGLGPGALASWAHQFLDGVQRRTGRVPILYTYPSFWHNAMKDNRTFGKHPLWLARYASTAPEPLPGWNRWTFWQRTSNHRLPGIVGAVDHNHFCCTAGTLTALADGRSLRITRVWSQLGGASGSLGLPLGPEVVIAGGWGQTFEKGYVAAGTRGTFAVTGEIYTRYQATGGVSGPLGLPVGPERDLAPGVREQRFVGGRIVRSAATGAHALRGAYLSRWLADGASKAVYGMPTGEQGTGSQQFVDGGLYLTPSGTRLVPGAIRERYEELGGPTSSLGLPVSEAEPFLDGRFVAFEFGRLTELVVAGQRVVI